MSSLSVQFVVMVAALVVMASKIATKHNPEEKLHMGAYKLKDNQNTSAYKVALQEMGYSPDKLNLILNNTVALLRVARQGDKFSVGWSISLCERISTEAANVLTGQEYDIKLCDGRWGQAVNYYYEGENKVVRVVKVDGLEQTQTVTEITDNELKVKYQVKDKEANLEFRAMVIQ